MLEAGGRRKPGAVDKPQVDKWEMTGGRLVDIHNSGQEAVIGLKQKAQRILTWVKDEGWIIFTLDQIT